VQVEVDDANDDCNNRSNRNDQFGSLAGVHW
jgi:hypothetical protein